MNKYGAECEKRCDARQCSGISTCNHVTGECINDCKPGYQGIDCIQVQCTDGCKPGYREDDCTVKCETGLYGAGCSKKYSDRKCDDNTNCDSKTGECIDGCQPGFQFTDCTLECDEGFYGYNCSSNCSARFCQSEDQCSKIDGACDCLAGYQGTDCTLIKEASKDNDKDTGHDNKDTTIIILAVVISILVVILIIFVVVFIKYRKSQGTNHTDNNVYESNGPTTAHIYDDLGSRNPENFTNHPSSVYYNTSGVSIDASQ
ncbi:hypothetical protein LOTGIDRAFT_156004 [Lottia gigantea]|uniref:EGF-like domain-containing protein n=1 Tax=Lottia gigantea TaxID=225164 RepID=V4CQN6_LOTGI|nr:hypothetical protein LOTGIDRAFT_156004 [Lottia gigantea]ESP04780.1 hypothetical protein LOTGIDRAFT_156004 [Lottia gigantea]